MQFDVRNWYRPHLNFITSILLPFSLMYRFIVRLRRSCYQYQILPTHRFHVPVIVVGNVTVGGTGKTPCVIALTKYLSTIGYHPGIVSRGVGGKLHRKPQIIVSGSLAKDVGDEAVLLARKSACPVVVGVDRVAAVAVLLKAYPDCNIVVSDDGLQHYRLGRDIEVAVVDGSRYFGNGYLLPAGPMREPRSRLRDVDFIVVNGGELENAYQMHVVPQECVNLSTQSRVGSGELKSGRCHAVAGIGNPDKFFQNLRELGYQIIEHAFPDHHPFTVNDFNFGDTLPILMTEKDAVKCEDFADDRMWCMPISSDLDSRLLDGVKSKLQGVNQCERSL